MRWYRGLEIVSVVGGPNPSSAESSSWLIRSVTRDEVEDSNAEENQGFNNKMKQMNNKNHPEGEKQAGRQKTGAQSTWNSHETHERQRISTGLQTQGDYIGRQTRVTRETQLEPLKQWLSNKMGGDRQSTWEHMAPNKQQAMCSTHRDIWWPAWAHQQDRDTHTHSFMGTVHSHFCCVQFGYPYVKYVYSSVLLVYFF